MRQGERADSMYAIAAGQCSVLVDPAFKPEMHGLGDTDPKRALQVGVRGKMPGGVGMAGAGWVVGWWWYGAGGLCAVWDRPLTACAPSWLVRRWPSTVCLIGPGDALGPRSTPIQNESPKPFRLTCASSHAPHGHPWSASATS